MKQMLLLLQCALLGVPAAGQTVGLLKHKAQSLDDGAVLFAPLGSTTTYLIDKCGRQLKTWPSTYKPGQSVYLLPNGTLLRTGNANNTTFTAGGKGGVIEMIDWSGNVTWSYTVSDATKCQHHDVAPLPNGNILVIAWEGKTKAEAIAQGRNAALVPATLWSEQILEIQSVGAAGGNVVWEWHLFDHLVQDFDSTKPNYGVVAASLQLVNINAGASATQPDWIHLNSIDYNAASDQILISSHATGEVWIIDHSTSRAEAASHAGGNSGTGGDLLYRWGNPQTYNAGTTADQKFFGQHNARWIAAGLPHANAIMVFNNGIGRPGGAYSTVDVIVPPANGFGYVAQLPYGPAAATVVYNGGNAHNFYAQNISGAQQLQNGHVLVANGPAGTFTEVDSVGTTVWEYVNPVAGTGILAQGAVPAQNLAFRCSFYPGSYAGFAGRALVAGATLESSNAVSAACGLGLGVGTAAVAEAVTVFPNPVRDRLTVSLPAGCFENAQLWNAFGQVVLEAVVPGSFDVSRLAGGVYYVRVGEVVRKVVKW